MGNANVFDSTPEDLIDATLAVMKFLEASPEQRREYWFAPSANERDLTGAISYLGTTMKIREDWLQRARVLRTEVILDLWEDMVSVAESEGWEQRKDRTYWNDFIASVEIQHGRPHYTRQVAGVGISWMKRSIFLSIGLLKADYDRLCSRWINILLRLPNDLGRKKDDVKWHDRWRKEVAAIIRSRCGCVRRDDPHRNELACKLMLAHFDMPEEWVFDPDILRHPED